jgi:hypothetical protein
MGSSGMPMVPKKEKKMYMVTAVTTKSGGKKGVQNTGSKFKSKTPISAAKKAASRICSKSKIKGRCALNITIQQIDSSSNLVGKPMHYHVLRSKTNSPVAVDHGGNEVVHKYTLTAKRIHGDLPHNRTPKKKAKVVIKKTVKKIKVPKNKNKNLNVNINITKQLKQQTPLKKTSSLPLQPIIVQKKPLFQQQKQLSLPPILQEQTQFMRPTPQKKPQQMLQVQKSGQMIQQQKKPQQMLQVQKSGQMIQQQKKPQQQMLQVQKSGQMIQQQKKPQQQMLQVQKTGQMIQQQKKPQQQMLQVQKSGVQQQAPKKRGFFF